MPGRLYCVLYCTWYHCVHESEYLCAELLLPQALSKHIHVTSSSLPAIQLAESALQVQDEAVVWVQHLPEPGQLSLVTFLVHGQGLDLAI